MALNVQKQGNFKEPLTSGMQRGKFRRGSTPGKKPGAMHQINVEVKTRKNCQKTGNFGNPTDISQPPLQRRGQVDSRL